jgi:hypothetical protein
VTVRGTQDDWTPEDSLAYADDEVRSLVAALAVERERADKAEKALREIAYCAFMATRPPE